MGLNDSCSYFWGFYLGSPYLTPILILFGGIVASTKYRRQQKVEKKPIKNSMV